jgi:hypothetical protein
VQKLGWGQGDQLESRINARGLLLYKVERRNQIRATGYDSFREAITRVLITLPKGCTWSELRQKTDLPQLTPSPIWVRRMEDEKHLERIRDPKTSQVIWRLPRELPVVTDTTLNGWTKRQG